MKKIYLTVGLVLTLAASMTFSSCIGSFALTNKMLDWNRNVGNKFVNELVFIAFWVLPVYEVTSLADLLVLNSIEFWSGSSPIAQSTKTIDTESGSYLVECDGKGYTITEERTGQQTRMDFDEPTSTWSLRTDEGDVPFLTFVDDSHVKVPAADGTFMTVETSPEGLMAYRQAAGCGLMMACAR